MPPTPPAMSAAPDDPPPPMELVDRDIRYESPFSRVRVDAVRTADGDETSREIVEHLGAVGAVAIDDEDRVVLVRQYRHSFGVRFLELPAGKLDVEGEEVEAAMQRELAEEVELEAGSMEHLVTFTNSAGWTTEVTTVLLATDLRPAARPEGFELAHEEADMRVLRVPVDEAVAMVRDGRIVDSKTVIGLLAVADRRAQDYVKR